jgi:hypothetical protein
MNPMTRRSSDLEPQRCSRPSSLKRNQKINVGGNRYRQQGLLSQNTNSKTPKKPAPAPTAESPNPTRKLSKVEVGVYDNRQRQFFSTNQIF